LRVLFDQNVPRPLSRFLSEHGHEVKTSDRLGWGALKDAPLLNAAEAAGFNVLVTTDQNIVHQQNLGKSQLGVVALGSNIWPIVQKYETQILSEVNKARPGTYAFIDMPNPKEQSRKEVENQARSFLSSDKTTVRDLPIDVREATEGMRIKGPVIADTKYHLALRSASNTVYILDKGRVRQPLGRDPAMGETLDISVSKGVMTVKPVSKERGTGR